MLEHLKTAITIDKLRNDEKNIIIKKNSSDLISYPEFLKYFLNLESISKHNLIIGINFTYAWMPTIFNFKSNKIDQSVIILNSAKNGYRPNKKELELLKECFNNSLVGTSKLLHFINPEVFTIWDSRIYRYLKNEAPHKYRVENINSYLDFLKFCDYIIENEEYSEIHNSLENKVGYKMSKHRTLDLIMYLNGGDVISKRI
jgi:hypothetical protein